MSNRSDYHHGNLREALIIEALGLLSSEGEAAVSLRQVAARAGVSRAAPYHHFKDKDALIAAVTSLGFDRLTETMRQAQASCPGAGLEQLRACGRSYLEFAATEPALYRLMFGPMMGDKAEHPALYDAAMCSFGVLLDVIVQGQAAGEIRAGEPRMLGIAAWSTVHGLSSLSQNKGAEGPLAGVDPSFVANAVLDVVVAGLRA